MYHDKPSPQVSDKKITLMVRGAAKEDAKRPKGRSKPAVMIPDLIKLVAELAEGPEEHITIMDLVVVAFWGMARLGELVCTKRTTMSCAGLTVRNVAFSRNGETATLTLRNAKTAALGELQYIHFPDCLGDKQPDEILGDKHYWEGLDINTTTGVVWPLVQSRRGIVEERARNIHKQHMRAWAV
ncbi:hypothetical protein MJO29_014217 [Puccinia striiformis f. sp. tritici]|nr:hypothetical protein MJO29_014217 [Puccinia striiformis f. sp. tritici]